MAQVIDAAQVIEAAQAIEAAQVIEERIDLAREMREADRRGEKLGLSEDEVAFYDALETNDSAVAVPGDETLRAIAAGAPGGRPRRSPLMPNRYPAESQ